MLSEEALTILGLMVSIIGLATTGMWYVIRSNKREIRDLTNSFHDDLKVFAKENRDDSKDLGEQLHRRISEHGQDLHQFKVLVAEQHPKRHEMDQRIDNAVQPMIREMQAMREQIGAMNTTLNNFIQSQSGGSTK